MTTTSTAPATITFKYAKERAAGRITRAAMMGRKAVYKTYEGAEIVGTITGVHDNLYLVVTFPNGKHARLDSVIELVVA